MSHYRLHHGQHSTVCPLPCLHHSCMRTFKTYNSLKVHMSVVHKAAKKSSGSNQQNVSSMTFQCPLCEFRQAFSENVPLFKGTFET